MEILAINPPYYRKQPLTEKDYAWYCGENGEYFQALFNSLEKYIHKNSLVLMVISEACDIDMITEIASAQHFYLQQKLVKRLAWEYFYIYQITGACQQHLPKLNSCLADKE